ncbi:MAG: serpin family protein [Candidatus Atribacteria bacterium]|nr:serpin family protein [Candidatus Atribacteria bacterium]
MKKIIISTLMVGVFIFFCGGCVVSVPSPPLVTLPVEEQMIRGINEFGVSLLRELWKTKEENLFLSPAGIEMALSMAAGGARGKTQEEMLRVMGLSGMTLETIRENNLNLVKMLNGASAKVEVRTANSLWARKGIPFYESFLANTRQYYQAEAEIVDFADPETLSRINQWVNKATHSKIDRILDRIPQDAILVLLNAIYFKGKWLYRFDPQKTQSLPFYLLSGEPKNLPTMWQKGKFRYTENDRLQAIRLPYGDPGFSMYIILPREVNGVEELLHSLDASDLEAIIQGMSERQGEVYLPRFTITFEEVLNDILKSLGMRDAFDEMNADFSGMLPIPPVAYVSEVKHKSVLEVTEEGTEAAAVTSVTINLTAAPPEESFLMRVDHPFLLCIRDERNGLFLFVGVVTNPESM